MNVSKEQSNGVTLTFNGAGYIGALSFEAAARWHCPYATVLSCDEAVERFAECNAIGNKMVSLDHLTTIQNGATYIHPQVVMMMCSYLDRPFTDAVMILMLSNHRKRNPGQGKAPPCPEDIRLKLAQEKTKQLQLKADATKKGLSALESYSVNSKPHVVDLMKSIFSGMGDVYIDSD